MRTLFFFIFFVTYHVCNAQDYYDDFEGNTNISSWNEDNCELVAGYTNPYKSGINTSNKVLKYDDQGGQYANIFFNANSNLNLANYYHFKLKIYISSNGISGNQPNQISLKLQDGSLSQPWSTQSEIIQPVTLNTWQEVTFDFKNGNYINLDGNSLPPTERSDFNRVLLQINGENNADKVIAYIDDFVYDDSVPNQNDPVFDNLVWSDEFDGTGLLDTDKWFYQSKLPAGGSWYNGEIQHYTDRVENAYQQSGNLQLVAKKETYFSQGHTKNYTSARLNSKYAFTYGKVEVKAKLPTGVGTWPAIWMLGKNIQEDGAYWQTQGFGTTAWPACGEIDIMEHWGKNQNYVSSAMHTPSSFGATENHGGQSISTVSSEFHVYSVVWSPTKMVFSVDGNVHYTYDPTVRDADTWPFDAPQYLILNIAIEPGIDPNFTEGAMVVDYVRVYQESPLSIDNSVLNADFTLYPNPVKQHLFITSASQSSLKAVEIFDQTGKSVLKSNKSKITLSTLSKGFYFVKIIDQEGRVHFNKLVKQ